MAVRHLPFTLLAIASWRDFWSYVSISVSCAVAHNPRTVGYGLMIPAGSVTRLAFGVELIGMPLQFLSSQCINTLLAFVSRYRVPGCTKMSAANSVLQVKNNR